MKTKIVIPANKLKQETPVQIHQDGLDSYTAAYIGKYTYCCGTHIDNGAEFTINNNQIIHNLHFGNFNSVGDNLSVILSRNHSTKMLDTGSLQLMLANHGRLTEFKNTYTQKGTVIIQNDVWFGENVTIMPSIIVRNGAVVARNSHVVKDVPPYAIVGGNPARIIGYRFTKEQIRKLQEIQWWFWDDEKLLSHAQYITEDIDRFCNMFYPEAHSQFLELSAKQIISHDTYFAFVDYYEGYSTYPLIIEDFLNNFINSPKKKLVLFIQDDCPVPPIQHALFEYLENVIHELKTNENVKCEFELVRGPDKDAKNIFLNCSYFITSRAFRTVYYSCLADLFGIQIIHGVDSPIPF